MAMSFVRVKLARLEQCLSSGQVPLECDEGGHGCLDLGCGAAERALEGSGLLCAAWGCVSTWLALSTHGHLPIFCALSHCFS